MIAILHLEDTSQRQRVESLLGRLRLDVADVVLSGGPRARQAAAVQEILADVAARGDQAIVDSCRKFDDPDFTAAQIRVDVAEMAQAAQRVDAQQLTAIRRSIAQVRQYQAHVMPPDTQPLTRPGVELSMRFTPLDSAGLCVPGGKAAYPSSIIMLAVPAQVAGVDRILVCAPPSKYGRSDLMLATYHELGLTEVFRAGGAAAVGAMAFGTATISRVDKIVGPGNSYVQLAKRALAGVVGIDGYLGPSEVLVLADETGHPAFIASDLLAQAEHDPGSGFLLTTSAPLAKEVVAEIQRQLPARSRGTAISRALDENSAIIVDGSMDRLVDLANRFAAEHVNLQTADDQTIMARLRHAGAIYLGAYSPIAMGDYIAGPSHCLPTNTTARFSSGISVYEFLKRSSVARYEARGLAADAPHVITLANAEHLDAHAASVQVRMAP